MSGSEDRPHPDVKIYLGVFAALMVLTAVTVLVSYVHLPPGPAVGIGLLIAGVKASLVAAYFMHLKGERLLIYGCLGVTFFFMALLFLLPYPDSVLIQDRRLPQPPVEGHPAEPGAGAEH